MAGLVTNSNGLIALRFFVGILGASFVPCQVWTTGFFDKNVSRLHAEQRLQIRSGVEDHLLPGFAFPQGRLDELLFRDIEAVTGDFHRPVFGIPHQLEFSMCPAILATLGAE